MKDQYLQIESYLLGELSAQESAAFKAAMQTDPALSIAVEQHREMQQRLLGKHLRNKVDTALLAPDGRASGTYTIWIIGLVILLTIALFWYFSTKTKRPETTTIQNPVAAPAPEQKTAIPNQETQDAPVSTQKTLKNQPVPPKTDPQLFAHVQQFYTAPATDFVREATENENKSSVIQQASTAFSAKNYRLAADLLRDDAQVRANESALFLRANARFKAGDLAAATVDFKRLENSFQYQFDARWNLILCEIAQGHIQQPAVQNTLNGMIADPDFPFNEAAKKLKANFEKK